MVEYNKVIVKLSNSQLNKLKTAVKNKKGVTLRMKLKCLILMEIIYLMNYY